jgi:peptide/nickel transport system permease protein
MALSTVSGMPAASHLAYPRSASHAFVLRFREGAARLWANRLVRLGFLLILGLVAAVLIGPAFSPHSATTTDLAQRLLPPSSTHLLGTDDLGRDVLTRILAGGRATLLIVFGTMLLMVPIGLVVGVTSGFLGGAVDAVLMRITDIFLAFPRLVLALALVASLGPSLQNAIIAVALTSWPAYARIARAETLTLKRADFITILTVMGASRLRIIFLHIMPLCVSSVLVRATVDLAGIIIITAGLGFLGLGVQPPYPEWGAMVSDGRRFMQDQWWIATFPGLAILLVSLGFNLVGDGLRDVMDPRS